MAICPLLTKTLMDGSDILSGNSGSHSKGAYTVEKIDTYIAQVWMDCVGANCRWWDATHNECSLPTMNLFNYHIHDSHEHVDSHTVGEVPADAGSPIELPSGLSKANLLSQEYMNGEDTDANGFVFGIDFALDINDSEVPRMLLTILNSPDFPVGLDIWSWQDYLDTL